MSLTRRRVRRTRPLQVTAIVPNLALGGAERHITTLLSSLDSERFTASLICLGEPGALFDDLLRAGVPARALRRTKWQAIGTVVALVREFRRTRPDVIVLRSYDVEVLGRIAAVLARVPRRVVWVHNCGDRAPRSRLRRLTDRVLDPVTDAYYGVAHGQLPYLTEDLGYPARKIQIIQNGTDISRFPTGPAAARNMGLAAEWGIGPDDPVVGSLAMLRPEKDHATLLRAARLVVDELPSARFVLVGEGPQRPRLAALVEQLGIAGNVVLAGARSDVPEVLSVFDVFTLTSITVECFPISLLEAMAAARPAVCTAVGGVPEILVDGETGYLVQPGDPAMLAAQLLRLLRDPALAVKQGSAARERVEANFTEPQAMAAGQDALERTACGISQRRRPINLTVVLDRTFVGGIENLLLNLFRSFNPDVVRPTLVCLREDGPLAADFRASGFAVHVLGRAGWWDVRTIGRLLRRYRADGTDVVMVTHHARGSLTLGRVSARLGRVPANVVAVHGMNVTRVGGRCLPRHDVETLFLSSALVLLTESQRRYLRREEGVGSRRWRTIPEVIIPNGITVDAPTIGADRAAVRRELHLDDDDFVVGIVARLSAEKAHHVLFEAVALVVSELPHLRLVVVGDGNQAAALRALAERLGIDVVFTGTRRDVATLLPAFDVSALSSVHEGVPIAILESMAAGIPVVATDSGGLRDIVADGIEGYVVPVGDVTALADRLRRLGLDPELRDHLGRNARRRAERDFCIEQTARRFERLFDRLVGDRVAAAPVATDRTVISRSR